jgi:RNA polymerase sigma-70 factor (ECF subfamily)
VPASSASEARAQALAVAGPRAWPDIKPSPRLLAAIERWSRLPERPSVDLGEVYLALACVEDIPVAMRLFDERYLVPVEPALAPQRLGADELAEVRQRVRIRLFVQQRDDLPVVLHYAGQGRLGGLVRVVMIREALRMRSSPTTAELTLEALDPRDPELLFADDERQQLARQVFARAAAALTGRERCLLRLHYVRGVSGAQIALMHGVHRATAVRWLESARLHLLQGFSRELRALMPDLPRGQHEQLAAWFDTHLELSLSRLLATLS